jgi:predicted trehalose synthase
VRACRLTRASEKGSHDPALKDHGADQHDGCGQMQRAHGDQRLGQLVLQCVHARRNLLTDPEGEIPLGRVGIN